MTHPADPLTELPHDERIRSRKLSGGVATIIADATGLSKADSAAQQSKPRAHKPKKRHRIVRRPPPQQLQQALDPFGQQQQTLATTAARTR